MQKQLYMYCDFDNISMIHIDSNMALLSVRDS